MLGINTRLDINIALRGKSGYRGIGFSTNARDHSCLKGFLWNDSFETMNGPVDQLENPKNTKKSLLKLEKCANQLRPLDRGELAKEVSNMRANKYFDFIRNMRVGSDKCEN